MFEMNFVPEEVLQLILKHNSNTHISSLKSVSKYWYNCIVKYQDELYNNNIIKCLDHDPEKYRKPIQMRTNKIYKIIQNVHGIPKYIVITNRDITDEKFRVFDLHDFSEKYSVTDYKCDIGTNFYLARGNVFNVSGEYIDNILYYYEVPHIVNDYIFILVTKEKGKYLRIGDINSFKERGVLESGFFKELLWHNIVTNVIYQNNKYIVLSSESFTILDNKFNILHTICTKDKFVYVSDTFYIVKGDKYYIHEYDTHNIIQGMDCPNCISYIIYNHMYLINSDGMVKIYNLITHKFENSTEMDKCYIYEFNIHFILFKKGSKLYCIDF